MRLVQRQAEVSDFEKGLDRKLASDDFDKIAEAITPKSLGVCSTNTLLKAFEVSGYLRYQAHQDRPDVKDLANLADSVEEFATCLIDPLKSDTKEREAFGETLDLIIDNAINYKQEKFLSHPVVYNLLDKIWRGRFVGMKSSFWKWTLLRLYCVLDVFLFPLVFAVLFAVNKINDWRRKSRVVDLCFILNATGEKGPEDFKKMIECIKYIIGRIGVSSVNYCIISFNKGKAFQHITFGNKVGFENARGGGDVVFHNDRGHLIRTLDNLEPPGNCSPALHEDLEEALRAFSNSSDRETSKKVLILLTNDATGSHGPQRGRLRHKARKLAKENAKIVPVAVRDRPVVEDLERIASERKVIRTELESRVKLGKKLVREIYEEDLYDKYYDYFTTPYFIFLRDTFSYLLLLGLHVVICFSPATVPFSALEWAILVFFVGRFLSEFKQYSNRAVSRNPRKYLWRLMKHRRYHYQESEENGHDIGQDEIDNAELPMEVKDFRGRMVFSGIGKYFSDRWNVLDFTMLSIYVTTLMLRMITWGVSSSVTGNKALVIAGYLYGFNTMILTLRVFGHLMETNKATGTTHIALISIIVDVGVIFFQFSVSLLAFSMAITKIYVADGSYSSSAEKLLRSSKGNNAECQSSGVACWWQIMKHLLWTLLGITELEPFNASETASDTLAKILYAIFIIGSLVLLVNMMIAVLSHTYERVQKNSLRAWSFKKAVTIRTYRDYHPIPVPLNLLSQLFLALRRTLNFYSNEDPDDDTIEIKFEALDRVVQRLKSVYFAKYGYAFPLSDDNKINNMLAETDRNREMCNQIVRRVFPNPAQTPDLCYPVGPSAWKSAGIHIEDYMLAYVGPEICSSCNISLKEFHGARYKLPFSKELPKFEVIVQEGGMKRYLVVGVVRVRHDEHKAPGEVRNTVGYHAYDGNIIHCDDSNEQHLTEGPVVYRGDLIGCRAGFDEAEDGEITISFSLNGQVVAKVPIKMGSDKSDIFPFVGMKNKGIRVLAKMCPSEVKDKSNRQSLEVNGKDTGSMFDETEKKKTLFQTYESVKELKESRSDILLRYMQENLETLKKDADKQREKVMDIESNIKEQNRKMEDLHSTLNEILNILKDKNERE